MGGIIVVALQEIPMRGDEHIMWVAHILPRRSQARSVRVDPHGHAPHVNFPVRAFLSDRLGVSVITTGKEVPAVLGFEIGPAIPEGKMPLSAWGAHHRMNGVVVILVLKTGQKHFPFVNLGIEYGVPVHVRVNDDRRSCRKNNPVIEDGNAKRGMPHFLLRNERMRVIGLSVPVLVLHHHDGASGLHPQPLVVIDSLRYPKSSVCIEVHRHGRINERRPRPQLNSQISVSQFKGFDRYALDRSVHLGEAFAIRSRPPKIQGYEKQKAGAKDRVRHPFIISNRCPDPSQKSEWERISR